MSKTAFFKVCAMCERGYGALAFKRVNDGMHGKRFYLDVCRHCLATMPPFVTAGLASKQLVCPPKLHGEALREHLVPKDWNQRMNRAVALTTSPFHEELAVLVQKVCNPNNPPLIGHFAGAMPFVACACCGSRVNVGRDSSGAVRCELCAVLAGKYGVCPVHGTAPAGFDLDAEVPREVLERYGLRLSEEDEKRVQTLLESGESATVEDDVCADGTVL